MTPHKRRESISRVVRTVVQPVKNLFKTPPRRERSVAAQEAEPSPPGLVSGLHPGLLTPDPTPSKRKASTSAPPSPTTIRPPGKRLRQKLPLSLFSSRVDGPAQLPLSPAALSPQSLLPRNTEAALDAAADYERDRVLLQRPCQASRSADSLASDRSRARASARASDESDANRVLKIIKELKSETYKVEKGGPGGKYLVQRKLHRPGYKLLLKKLAEEDKRLAEEYKKLAEKDERWKGEDTETLQKYVKHRLRFDYIPRPCKGEKQFTVHMPSRMHEGMAGALSDMIVQWYGDIRKGQHCKHAGTLEATKTVARKLQSVLATRVEVDDETRQEPDLSFTYDRGMVAGLVVEVAWSQSLLRLPERADRYIKGSEGDVRTVVGINLNDIYNGGRRAWFSVWQAQFNRESQKWTRVTTVDHQMFIDGDGEPIEDCALRLSLKDFISEENASEAGVFENVPLEISATELHRFYEDSLQPHVCAEIKGEKELISNDVEEVLKNILGVKKILQGTEVAPSGEEKAVGSKEFTEARDSLKEAQKQIDKRRRNMEVMKENLEKVGNKKSKDVQKATKMLVEAEEELAELENKIAETRAELEAMPPPETEEVAVEKRTLRASEIKAAGPSVPQASSETPRSLARVLSKSKARLPRPRKKVSSA